MKKRNKTLLALLVMVIFSLIVFVPAYSREGFPNAKPTRLQEHTPTISPTSLPSVSRVAIQKYADAQIQSSTINGVEISASNFRVEGAYLKINTCFESPNNKEWLIGEAIIQIGDEEFLLRGAKALEISQTHDDGHGEVHIVSDSSTSVEKMDFSVPNYRCDSLRFVVPETLEFPVNVSLTIKSIQALPREETGCFEYHGAVQKILDQNKSNVKVDCNQINGKSEFVITKNSSSMTDEEARNIVYAAYLESFTINGPWVFTGVVDAPPVTPTETQTQTTEPTGTETPLPTETSTELPTETPLPTEPPTP